MIGWRRLYPKPAGSLPGGIVTQWGVGIITILVLVFLTYWIYFGGGKEAGFRPIRAQSRPRPGASPIRWPRKWKQSRFERKAAAQRRSGRCSSRDGSNGSKATAAE